MNEETQLTPQAQDNDQVEDDRPGPPTPEELDQALEHALDFMEGLLDTMDLPGEVGGEITDGGTLLVEVVGEPSGILIGRRGATLNAVQHLLRTAVQRKAERALRIVVDAEGYRQRRRASLEKQAREDAEVALKTGESAMEPMPAFERKIIHDAIGEIQGVTSESEGEEPYRRVIIRRQGDRNDEQEEDSENPQSDESGEGEGSEESADFDDSRET